MNSLQGDPDELVVRVDGEILPRWKVQSEYEMAMRIADRIANPPQPACYQFNSHLWEMSRMVCARCGITAKDFHQVRYGNGLPCRVIITDSAGHPIEEILL